MTFATGKLVALLGPSCSGKTTLLGLLAGLEIPDPHPRLNIRFGDRDVTSAPPGQRNVGMVCQHYALFRHMTVAQNIAFGLDMRPRLSRPTQNEIQQRVEKLLAQVQLEAFGNRYPHQLSGGQRQRVAFARALAIEPQVLLLDEPFGALDAKVRKELRQWLRQFHNETGITTIFVTQDQEEALELADEIVVLHRERVEQAGAPQRMYDEPGSKPSGRQSLTHLRDRIDEGGESSAFYLHFLIVRISLQCSAASVAVGHFGKCFKPEFWRS